MIVLSNIKNLYDGSSGEKKSLKSQVDVVIDKGKIKEVVKHQAKRPATDTLIDCSTFTVTPGLIDCHGHISILGLSAKEAQVMNSHKRWFMIEKILFKTLVDGGVTTLRDVGGATHFIKNLIEEGVLLGPRLKIAICMLSTTGGHADFRGPDRCHAELSTLEFPQPGCPSNIVDGPWECRKRIREIAACGADLIKICASPGVASPSDRLEHQDFSAEEIIAICEEAKARGLKVAAHAHSVNGIRMAIDYGVSDIQHMSYMNKELVEKAYEKNCTVTPTSWVIHELETSIDSGIYSDLVKEKIRQVSKVHRQAVQYAAKGGLRILAGTDSVMPNMHGKNFLEIHHLIQDGLKPLQAWHGMTGLAASEIGIDAGVIEAGKKADFLICKNDVIEKPELLGQGALLEVVKDGEGYRGGLAKIPQKTFKCTADAVLR